MNIKDAVSAPVWTNVFFLIPLLVAWRLDLDWFALFLIIVIWVSTSYHFLREEGTVSKLLVFGFFDIFSAAVLVLWGIVFVVLSLPMNVFSGFALIFFIGALLFFRRQYQHEQYAYYHGWWHIFASLGIVCCELSFYFHTYYALAHPF